MRHFHELAPPGRFVLKVTSFFSHSIWALPLACTFVIHSCLEFKLGIWLIRETEFQTVAALC